MEIIIPENVDRYFLTNSQKRRRFSIQPLPYLTYVLTYVVTLELGHLCTDLQNCFCGFKGLTFSLVINKIRKNQLKKYMRKSVFADLLRLNNNTLVII